MKKIHQKKHHKQNPVRERGDPMKVDKKKSFEYHQNNEREKQKRDF